MSEEHTPMTGSILRQGRALRLARFSLPGIVFAVTFGFAACTGGSDPMDHNCPTPTGGNGGSRHRHGWTGRHRRTGRHDHLVHHHEHHHLHRRGRRRRVRRQRLRQRGQHLRSTRTTRATPSRS
ncbi:MAG: hypothetical protein R3B70_30310 [Polyangiaceae bacterium]